MTKRKPQLQKLCKGCGDEFYTARATMEYCAKILKSSCGGCGSPFESTCGARRRFYCQKGCASRATRLKSGGGKPIPCAHCGDDFIPRSQNGKYCLATKKAPCLNCSKLFDFHCSGPLAMKHCSHSCRNTYMRTNLYELKDEKSCLICGDVFRPTTSRQRVCPKAHLKLCLLCGEPFDIDFYRRARWKETAYCDNVCSTLAQMQSKLSREKVNAYKKADLWAISFKETHGRKPNSADWRLKFDGVNIPNFASKELFSRTPTSFLEEKVKSFLEETYPRYSFKRNSRYRFDDGWLELDFYSPELSLGFEVQDFGTHDKTREQVAGNWGPKKGPEYHSRKIAAYSSIGITVFELWEDSIVSELFKDHVRESIEAAEGLFNEPS